MERAPSASSMMSPPGPSGVLTRAQACRKAWLMSVIMREFMRDQCRIRYFMVEAQQRCRQKSNSPNGNMPS